MSREVLEDDTSRSAIPVFFHISNSCKPTDESDPHDKIIWQLKIEEKLRGVDYMTQFEVPVFRIEASREDHEVSEELSDPFSEFRESEDPAKRLNEVGIRAVKNLRGGTQFNFRSGRNLGSSLGVTVIFLFVPLRYGKRLAMKPICLQL